MTAPDLLVANLVCDYLLDAASVAAGVPGHDTLPKLVMDEGKETRFPSVVVAAKEDKGTAGPRRVVQVSVMLLTWLQAETGGANVAAQTTRTTASTWLSAIDARLQDRTAFGVFLAALPAARKEGFKILKIVHDGAAPPMRVKNTGAINYALSLLVTLYMPPT